MKQVVLRGETKAYQILLVWLLWKVEKKAKNYACRSSGNIYPRFMKLTSIFNLVTH